MSQRTDGRQTSAGLVGAGLVATGTASTLLSKTLYSMRAPRRSDGHAKLFRKPLAATLFMFLGMTLILPLAPLIHWLQDRLRWRSAASTAASDDASTDAASAPLLASAGGHNGGGSPRRDGWLRQCALLLVPTLFDVVATATHKIGLMWLTVSVYQMLRGSQILYAALLSMLFLRRRLTRWHAGGLALVVSGIGLVGLAGLLAHPEVAPSDVSRRRMLWGMAITLLSELVHAAQIVVEDYYLAGLHLHPLTVVGVEGALGAAAMAGLVMPLAQRLPGADGRGLHEDSWDTLHMLAHSGRLRAVAACYVGVAGAFNLAGMLATDAVGAVFRTVLESLRTLSVWLLDLAIYYALDGEERRFGEPWTRASWLQALGFAMLASGTVVYSHADQLRSHTSATGLLSRFRRRRRQRHAAGAPAADAEASRAGGSDAA